MDQSAIDVLFQKQKAFFRSGQTRDIGFRIETLKKIKNLIGDHEKEILAAVYADLHKEATDAYATELSGVYNEIKIAIANVRDWAAAAKNLTPLTLELGGKSPAIIHESAHLETAANRIGWGKFLNAGQTCIAPDYVLVHESVKDAFIDELIKVILTFYGEDASKHPRYCRIINDRHFQRLTALLDEKKSVFGGRTNRADRYIEPTLLAPVEWNDPVIIDEVMNIKGKDFP